MIACPWVPFCWKCWNWQLDMNCGENIAGYENGVKQYLPVPVLFVPVLFPDVKQ